METLKLIEVEADVILAEEITAEKTEEFVTTFLDIFSFDMNYGKIDKQIEK